MRRAHSCARRLWRSAVLAVVGLQLAVVAAAPADAHAIVSGTDPEHGARLALAPGRVTLFVDAKLPTVEGDPLQVYGPDGERIDAGDTRVEDGGADAAGSAALSVGLRPDVPHPQGDYHVVYRLISADTHLVTGQFTFHCGQRPAVSPVRTLDAEPVALQRPSPAPPLAYGWSPDRWHWPKAAFITGVVLALGALTRRRHHGPAPPIPWSTGVRGLVAGYRVD